ncbi:hypothetical protein D3C78_569330 [compost metagenome]
MKFVIDSPDQLGKVIRASRKAMDMRQDDAAGSIGVSENFLGKVERGGETVQWGKLFQVMKELGLSLSVEVPDEFSARVETNLQGKAVRSKTTLPREAE